MNAEYENVSVPVMAGNRHSADMHHSQPPNSDSAGLDHSQPTNTWNPSLYDTRGSFVATYGTTLLDVLVPKSGERILDLGCGTGALTRSIADRGASTVGVDASPEMIEAAERQHPGLEWRVADGQALDFASEFDAVFSNAALHWMPNADGVAQGVRRALRAGGRFVAELGGDGCVGAVRTALHAELSGTAHLERAIPAWYFPSVAQYCQVLTRAGFEPRLLHLYERPTPVAGEDGLRTWLELFCAPLLNALGRDKSNLLNAVERRCRPTLFRDGQWVLDYVRLRVVALRP